jgi:hypothetical protein
VALFSEFGIYDSNILLANLPNSPEILASGKVFLKIPAA